MTTIYPLRLQASLHETIWGGQNLQQYGWKQLPSPEVAIGEAWETEISTVVQNGAYAGRTLGAVVDELGAQLLGSQAIAVFGSRFPLLAKFIDANAQLSVQVHPDDTYAATHEGGKLGKTEFWYILATEPGARIVYGFQSATSREEVAQAITEHTLERLLHEEPVQAGDVIYVPAGTVHAIGRGVLLYELQEYSDVTYRLYDYGRLTASGQPRELHIKRSLDVTDYSIPQQIKRKPIDLPGAQGYEDRCLVACRYFVTREIRLKAHATLQERTQASCVILSCLGEIAEVRYGSAFELCEAIRQGETMVLPAALGNYQVSGSGALLLSYVPTEGDPAWQAWQAQNS